MLLRIFWGEGEGKEQGRPVRIAFELLHHNWQATLQSKFQMQTADLVYLSKISVMAQFCHSRVMYLSNRSFVIPPGNPPGIWVLGKLLFKFPPPRAEKLFKCPHSRENYQITVSIFQTPFNTFHNPTFQLAGIIKYKLSLNTFKYGTKLVQAFGFQPLRHEHAIFSFEFIKVCLRRADQISSLPGRKKVSNARGMPGGDFEASI